jgi:ornithine cyclodeaminase/alanine dehydrogenase-like protein (mu-crystallin family)
LAAEARSVAAPPTVGAGRPVLMLSEADVRGLLGPREALECMRSGFAALHRGEVTQPAIMDLEFPDADGEAHLKGAHLHGSASWSVKAATGFWSNQARGLPVTNGLSLVFSAETGALGAILFDNGYLTELRTGAAGGLAADLLAPLEVEQAAIVGAGGQARYQLEALLQVRRPRRVVVASRTRARAEAYAAEMGAALGIEIAVADDVETAVRSSQLVVTTTPAREPVVRADWVQPGTHVTAMGSDFSEKQELEPALLGRADLVAADHPPVAARNGEIHHAIEAGAIKLEDVVALGALVTGEAAGRSRDGDITVCDLVGLGVQDAAVAAEVVRRAAETGAGRKLET